MNKIDSALKKMLYTRSRDSHNKASIQASKPGVRLKNSPGPIFNPLAHLKRIQRLNPLKRAPIKAQKQWQQMPQTEKVVNRIIQPDRDNDNFPDIFDCQPTNPNKDSTYKQIKNTKLRETYENYRGNKIIYIKSNSQDKSFNVDDYAYPLDMLGTRNLGPRTKIKVVSDHETFIKEIKKSNPSIRNEVIQDRFHTSTMGLHHTGQRGNTIIAKTAGGTQTLIHEVGHELHEKTPKRFIRFKNVSQHEETPRPPTRYGDTNVKEDFADSYKIWALGNSPLYSDKVKSNYMEYNKGNLDPVRQEFFDNNYGYLKRQENAIEKNEKIINPNYIEKASLEDQKEWQKKSMGEKVEERITEKDTDKDNTPDEYDCQPLNPNKQDRFKKVVKTQYGTSYFNPEGTEIHFPNIQNKGGREHTIWPKRDDVSYVLEDLKPNLSKNLKVVITTPKQYHLAQTLEDLQRDEKRKKEKEEYREHYKQLHGDYPIEEKKKYDTAYERKIMKDKTPEERFKEHKEDLERDYRMGIKGRIGHVGRFDDINRQNVVYLFPENIKDHKELKDTLVHEIGHHETNWTKLPFSETKKSIFYKEKYDENDKFNPNALGTSPTYYGMSNYGEDMAETFAVQQGVVPKEDFRLTGDKIRYGPGTPEYGERIKFFKEHDIETQNYPTVREVREYDLDKDIYKEVGLEEPKEIVEEIVEKNDD